jgi:crotonobetaine/carnitine-CoA ligase
LLETLERLGGPVPRATSASVTSEDALVVIYTSGTTGFPKGVVHTHRTYILAAEGFVSRMYLQSGERLLTVMPFFHINALFYSFGGALACGGALVTTARFSASQFWKLAADSGATEFNFLAAVGNILMNRPRSELDPRHRIGKLYGGPISERMHQVFREDFHVAVLLEGYGMTEIPGACCNPFLGPHKAGSIGLPAVHPSYPGAFSQLRIVDEDGRELPDGAVGELVVRTPMLFKEYLHDPKQTAAAFRDGWFLTGDLARRDSDGYFYFVARKKDIIRRRGENISGAELDRVISDHPQVQEAAAIGVPAELGEEEILVVVVPKPGGVQPRELVEWCRGRLPPMKVPRYVVLADALPHTPSHRVAKHRLKADSGLLARAWDAERRDAPA